MSEFKVPKRAVQEVEDHPSSSSGKTAENQTFEVPSQAIYELGKLAGSASGATELLEPTPTSAAVTKNRMLNPATVERERASRNFSFSDGETRLIFDKLSFMEQRKAQILRTKLISRFEAVTKRDSDMSSYEGIFSEETIGLLQVSLSGPSNRIYLAHLGTPIQNVPVITMNDAGTRVRSSPFQNQCTYLRLLGQKYPVINLLDTPAFDPQALSYCMGGTPAEWEKTLPPIKDKPVVQKNEHSWDLWAPTVRLR